MSLRKVLIAAVILAAALYLKFLLPELAGAALPALREAIAQQRFALRMPEAAEAWLLWR